MEASNAKRLRELQAENAKLKRIVAVVSPWRGAEPWASATTVLIRSLENAERYI